MKKSFVFSGSGGQGIMSAGITLAQAAIDMGKHATYLPEYGPEQRGGSAKCTVVISDEPIISPLPKKCDNLIAMTEQAFAKFGEDLVEGGVLIANSCRINNADEQEDAIIISEPVDDLALEVGNAKAANIILIGILIGATEIVSREALVLSLEQKFKEKKPGILEMNLRALDLGIEIGKKATA